MSYSRLGNQPSACTIKQLIRPESIMLKILSIILSRISQIFQWLFFSALLLLLLWITVQDSVQSVSAQNKTN